MAKQADPNQLVLVDVRLAFPSLFTPKELDGKERYESTYLLDKKADKKQLVAIHEIIERLIEDEVDGDSPGPARLPIQDGDEKSYDGYAGNFALGANRSASQGRPVVLKKDKTPAAESDGIIYGGCYVNAVVRFYAINGKNAKKKGPGGKRVCCSVEIVQFNHDGDRFGAPAADIDVLPDID